MMTEERITKLTSAVYKVTDLFPEKEPLRFAVRKESLDVLFSYVVLTTKSTADQKEEFVKKALVSLRAITTYFNLAESQNWIDSKNFSILRSEYESVIFWFEAQLSKLEIVSREVFSNGLSAYSDHAPESREVEKVTITSFLANETEKNSNVIDIVDNIPVKLSKTELPEDVMRREIEKESRGRELKVKKNGSRGVENEKRVESEISLGVSNINYEELSSSQLKMLEILQNKGFLKSSQISKYFDDSSGRSIRRDIKELKDKNIIVAKGSGKSTFYQLNYVY